MDKIALVECVHANCKKTELLEAEVILQVYVYPRVQMDSKSVYSASCYAITRWHISKEEIKKQFEEFCVEKEFDKLMRYRPQYYENNREKAIGFEIKIVSKTDKEKEKIRSSLCYALHKKIGIPEKAIKVVIIDEDLGSKEKIEKVYFELKDRNFKEIVNDLENIGVYKIRIPRAQKQFNLDYRKQYVDEDDPVGYVIRQKLHEKKNGYRFNEIERDRLNFYTFFIRFRREHQIEKSRKREEKDKITLSESVKSGKSSKQYKGKIFISHGRDGGLKDRVAWFLEKLDLEPIILEERVAKGSTVLLDQFEKEAKDVDYAIVLMTPDDMGYLKSEGPDSAHPRARQNVIFELGYFLGKLGHDRVCIFYDKKIELFSDFHGVLYVSYQDESWKIELTRKMKDAEIDIDLDKL